MADETSSERRRFCMTIALTFASAQVGMLTAAAAGMVPVRDSQPGPTRLPVEGQMPMLDGATGWLNSPPLRDADLRGNVVLVGFWTYTCINWLRSLPYLRAWDARYRSQGLLLIGAHAPEFPFEEDIANVRAAVAERGIEYPIAIDNDYAIWSAFKNEYWPALYFVDRQGNVRHHHFGEGDYEHSEKVIQALLLAGGRPTEKAREFVALRAHGIEAPADWDNLASPESYLGYGRASSFASPGGAVLNKRRAYTLPARLSANQWALAGEWTTGLQATALEQAGGRIACRFHARDLHLVMGPSGAEKPVPFRVRLNGESPGDAHGIDIDTAGQGTVARQGLYQLIRQPGRIADQTFDIEFLGAGVEAFAFTFG